MRRFNKVSVKIAFFLSTSMMILTILIGLFDYRYLSDELTKKTIKKDEQMMMQYRHQIESKLHEISVLSKHVSMDLDIQDYCKQNEHNYFEKSQIANKISKYFTLHDFVDSVVLVSNNETLWNKYLLDNSLNDFVGASNNQGFIDKWVIDNGLNSLIYIPYKKEIYDLNNPSSKIGELYILIDLKDVDKIINNFNQQNEEISLLFKDEVIVESPSLENEKFINLAKQNEKIINGKLLKENIENTEFSIVSYRSEQLLKSEISNVMIVSILLFVIMLSLTLLVIRNIVSKFTAPISQLNNVMQDFAMGDMNAKIEIHSHDEMEDLANNFNSMVDSINSLMEQKIEDEKIRKKLKFDMMISKIHPHFIYNTLNSVIVIAKKQGNSEVVEMVKALICILQDSMQVHKDLLFDTIRKECEVLSAYATIQKYRYKNKFELIINVDEEVKDLYIAKNILEPIVENAIFHGLVPKQGNGKVVVTIDVDDDYINISIEDDGVGMKENLSEIIEQGSEKLKYYTQGDGVHSIALINVLERMEYLYGKNGQIMVDSKVGVGTKFTIRVKKIEE